MKSQVRPVAGAATGDAKLEAEGKAQGLTGKAREALGDLKDKAEDAVDNLKDKFDKKD